MPVAANIATWGVVGVATGGVIARPFRLPEAIWAVIGAAILVLSGLLPWQEAIGAIDDGLDVYLFLTGMMLLSEVARREGLFDWLARVATRAARGSARRLFLLVYLVGTIVTVLLSNDACAVVLTPAVYAATKTAEAEPLPYLFVCAFIANAASFVLPISNPANLVLYASRMPPLLVWVERFAIPSILAIVVTYWALRYCEANFLGHKVASEVASLRLSGGGALAALGIGITAVVLLIASALDRQLGLPTCLAGLATATIVLVIKRETPWPLISGVSWAILPLVAGLFVLVAGLAHSGVIEMLAKILCESARVSTTQTALGAGAIVAFVCNLMNNLPAGLIAASTIAAAHPPRVVSDALLIGVDLGPNLSITGSLATILWLVALRREGIEVGFFRFLRVGLIVMPPALVPALIAAVFIR